MDTRLIATEREPGEDRKAQAQAVRARNIQCLMDEFSKREMTVDEASLLLKLPVHNARKYIKSLRNANLIDMAPYSHRRHLTRARILYCLRSGLQTMPAAAIDKLNETPPGDTGATWDLTATKEKSAATALIRRQHRHRQPTSTGQDAPAGRDPLVAALFGAMAVRP